VPAPASQANMFDVAWEWNPEPVGSTFGGAREKTALQKQAALAKQQNCEANPNNDQQRTNCEKLNNAAATVDLGLMQFKPGSYKYMSSRNNNFSNRAQKASLTTRVAGKITPKKPTHVTATALENPDNPNQAMAQISWSFPGEESPYIASDGKAYSGYSQEAQQAVSYTVMYNCPTGDPESDAQWIPTNCQTSGNSCVVQKLPAGLQCAFRVHAGNTGGWSDPSEQAAVQMKHSPTSKENVNRIIAEIDGSEMSTEAIAGIIIGVIVALVIILMIIWWFMGRNKDGKGVPPPPPPGGPAYGAGY